MNDLPNLDPDPVKSGIVTPLIAGDPCHVSCAEERPWGKGATLFNYLNTVRLQGITGSLALQERKDQSFNIFHLF